jgi:UV DNA damage endonuclease
MSRRLQGAPGPHQIRRALFNKKEEDSFPGTLRLGLCCLFAGQPIHFRTSTAAVLKTLPRAEQLRRLAALCAANAEALLAALQFCSAHGIGSFRVTSTLLPVKTHPVTGYQIADLPGAQELVAQFRHCGEFAQSHGIRTGFHPDQFVVLNSPDAAIVDRSIADIESQAEMAEWIQADTVNIHGGGGYGDKPAALERFRKNLDLLSDRARLRLTVENDDKTFAPADLLPICRSEGVPLVYDVHHHRCCPDHLSVEEASRAAFATWNREPLFHISSPLLGWKGSHQRRHHDYVDPGDFPVAWRGLAITVEVEAKAKELAVARLKRDLKLT